MSSNIIFRVVLFFFLSIVPAVVVGADKKEEEGDKRAKRIESAGDRKFVRQDFDEAMTVYESAFKYTLSPEYGAMLHLKVARLYLTLLDYLAAIPHYESAMTLSDANFTSIDICNYLDALRFSGKKMQAIGIARKYAYQDVYNSDQRYQNILHALNYEGGFLPIGAPEFTVRPLDNANTPNSEFWIGEKMGEYFYASSNSRFHDPSKRFYHRSNYYSLDTDSEFTIDKNHKRRLLDMIPYSLQNGPMSFSRNMTRMVVTQVYYGKGDKVGMTAQGLNTFQTRLYYSDYDERRRGWSSFKEAFPQKEGYSYSHPYLFNGDRSLLFSSDMSGGFGGYDLYVVHWDEQKGAWGEPVNLGSQINTEGDEISPAIFEEALIFSSNGHVGFGGYDIYGISFNDGKVVAGSLVHFAYPVNTVHNDFGLLHIDENQGYIVSDRDLMNKDNVFYFERNSGRGQKSDLLFGMSESKAVSSGAINLIREESSSNIPMEEKLPQHRSIDHQLSIYFDFDSYLLGEEAYDALELWKKEIDFDRVDTLIIEGYADDIGGDEYNLILSKKRALEVSRWMDEQGAATKTLVSGMGKTSAYIDFRALSTKYSNGMLEERQIYQSLPLQNKIWLNREARRVDIKVIVK